MTDDLQARINIGPKLAGGLRRIGVHRVDELLERGAVAIWEDLRSIEAHDCLHSLLALEGAVRGVRWHDLPPDVRAGLATHVRTTQT